MSTRASSNILDRIAENKRVEVALKKAVLPVEQLREFPLYSRKTNSLAESLKERSYGIIAEHKRRSPSKAAINLGVALPDVVNGYTQAGAGGISVLTDGTFFGGSLDDLLQARARTTLPLLRKEFILDSYQLAEARAYGADAILLIAAMLEMKTLGKLATEARELGLEVLLEVHSTAEWEACPEGVADLVGVNNRNLKTFEVSLDTSRELASKIPNNLVRVSESGLSSADDLRELKVLGYDGFLIGETFMKEENPGAALQKFLKNLDS